MNDLNTILAWVADHPYTWWAAGAATIVGILTWVVYRLVGGFKGRDLSAKANAGFSVVQAGLAYITITGGYEFWHGRVGMPAVEAWALAGFVEATVWASIGMIWVWAAGFNDKGEPNVGTGDAGVLFWIATVGGGLIAIAGSTSFPIGLGRTVVVVIGTAMWALRIRSKTRRSGRPSTLLISPTRLLKEWGILGVEDKDVVDTPREWQVRRLARAIRRRNATGRLAGKVANFLGDRAILRHAEQTKPDVLAEARERAAMAHVMRAETAWEAATMAPVLAAARARLMPTAKGGLVLALRPGEFAAPAADMYPHGTLPQRPPAPEPPPVAPPPVMPPPVTPPIRPAKPSAAKPVSVIRAHAELWAYDQLRAGNPVTSKAVGEKFGNGEEWGRQRLAVARARLAKEAPPVSAGAGPDTTPKNGREVAIG